MPYLEQGRDEYAARGSIRPERLTDYTNRGASGTDDGADLDALRIQFITSLGRGNVSLYANMAGISWHRPVL